MLNLYHIVKQVIDFPHVIAQLQASGIHGVEVSDFEEIPHASANNYLYKVDKRDVKVILRAGYSNKDIGSTKRSAYAFNLFSKTEGIPVPKVIATGLMRCLDGINRPYLIQEYVDANNLLQVKPKAEHLKHIAQILMKIHGLRVRNGSGSVQPTKFQGSHKSWYNYLRAVVNSALKRLLAAGAFTEQEDLEYRAKFRKLLKDNKALIDQTQKKFLHGDANLGNFLVDRKTEKIVAVLDLDFILYGDPAWEFVGKPAELYEYYLAEAKAINPKFSEESFRMRMVIYESIFYLQSVAAQIKKRRERIPKKKAVLDASLRKLL
jgi:aminoglycoside phosphotransferase (APT) family kinase protein